MVMTFLKRQKKKQFYDTRNNPFIKELKNTLNEIIELETQLKDKLNQDQQ